MTVQSVVLGFLIYEFPAFHSLTAQLPAQKTLHIAHQPRVSGAEEMQSTSSHSQFILLHLLHRIPQPDNRTANGNFGQRLFRINNGSASFEFNLREKSSLPVERVCDTHRAVFAGHSAYLHRITVSKLRQIGGFCDFPLLIAACAAAAAGELFSIASHRNNAHPDKQHNDYRRSQVIISQECIRKADSRSFPKRGRKSAPRPHRQFFVKTKGVFEKITDNHAVCEYRVRRLYSAFG